MATRLQLRALELAQALLRGFGFLAIVIGAYVLLHRAGIWDPLWVADYGWVALMCAVSLALWRRFPAAHLIGICLLVGDPLWFFSVGEVRAIPLVLAAFLSAFAGLSSAVAMPIVVTAALSSQLPRWGTLVSSPGEWGDYLLQNGLSRPILVCGLCVAAVLVGHATYVQRRIAASLRAQNEELARLRESDRARIATEERTAIAREVHDVVAHHLAAIVVRAQSTALLARQSPEDLLETVEWTAAAGTEALSEMRSLVRLLRRSGGPADPRRTPAALADALAEVVDRVRAAGIEVRAEVDVPAALSAVQEFAVLRVCQEAITNVLVHSNARAVDVELATVGEDAVLTVEDDGALDPAVGSSRVFAATAAGGGSGILGMHERAKAVGGVVTAGRSPRGWRVQLIVPGVGSAA